MASFVFIATDHDLTELEKNAILTIANGSAGTAVEQFTSPMPALSKTLRSVQHFISAEYTTGSENGQVTVNAKIPPECLHRPEDEMNGKGRGETRSAAILNWLSRFTSSMDYLPFYKKR